MVTLCNRCKIGRTYRRNNLNTDHVPQGGGDKELCYVKRAPVSIIALLMLAACGGAEPRSIDYFMSHEYALESALVRCSADRDAARRDPECINARIANDRQASTEEEGKRQVAEREFQRMRGSIRERQNKQQQARVRAEQEAATRAATIRSPGLNPRATSTPSQSGSPAPYKAPTTTPQHTTPQANTQTALAELQRLEAERRSAEQGAAQEALRFEEQRRLAVELAASEALRMEEQRRLTDEAAGRRLEEQRALKAEQEKAAQLRAEIDALRATKEAESQAIRRAEAERLEQERLAREAEERRIAADRAREAARIQAEIQTLEEERRRQQQDQEEAYRAQRELEARLEALKQSGQDDGS